MPNKFVLSRQGLAQLERSTESRSAMEKIAQEIGRRAEANGGRFTGEYKTAKTEVGARAFTESSFAHWDEWGSRYRVARAPMRRALSSMGLLQKTETRGKP